ncbi:DNA cytosine methyltransferase [Sideroxydans lithotrophicus]|uniref:DNA (cytosine-5-)-methyltransferase n=1 Tax=Sideroxydans lithotrophicus (strain ES-1) TaxID=580332 RepID=D5CT98_SIDLE|nr:DNA cytosine methyltransferase [Sideroxydans lithotrophicus]ADE12184.1 C-5 cytosine-specific DNA methylase [Sideroxydans lithotrophicus ES-1]
MLTPQYIMDLNDEIIIDNFAGGGGASTGFELALGRHVDVAINHDPEAVSMHQANHPQTRHYCESVWEVDPRTVHPGRKIGALWLSPDCKHFSKAKGGKPVEKKIRGLAWVALRWVAIRKPRRLFLENVEEFITWGPLVSDANGNMRPCPKNKGREFNAFVNALRRHGYVVDWKELRASDYDTPTIRKRLFLVARCDGQPIVWPEATHGAPDSEKVKSGWLLPWRTAAECIDWSLPCPSIFLTKEEGRAIGVNRPLADNTLRRVAKGIMRYVVNAAEPFIVPLTHHGADRRTGMEQPLPTVTAAHRGEMALIQPFITEHANGSNQRNMPADEPLRTQCAQVKGGHFAVVQPFISTYYGDKRPGDVRGISMDEPLHTQTTENRHALVSAFMAKHYGGVVGHSLNDEPLHTITSSDHNSLVTAHIVGAGGPVYSGKPKAIDEPFGTMTAENHRALVTSNIVKMRGTNVGQDNREPLHTISAQGTHFAEVRSFLIKYYGTDQDPQLREPLHTVTTKDRYGLVTVHGEEYAIVDIGMRMLAPRELFRAQGFPEKYIIDRGLHIDADGNHHWKPLTKSAQVRMCGNSVCPPLAAALIRANCADMIVSKEVKRRSA